MKTTAKHTCPICKTENKYRILDNGAVEFALSTGGNSVSWFTVREDATKSTCNKCYAPIPVPRTFWRVGSIDKKQGLWYDVNGKFTGEIHNKYSFCKSSSLPMEFNPDISGWLSCTSTLKDLYMWFPFDDLILLEKEGFFVYEYVSFKYKKWENHWLMEQENSNPLKQYSTAELKSD